MGNKNLAHCNIQQPAPNADLNVGNKRPTFSAAFESPAKLARLDRFKGRFHSPGAVGAAIENFEKLWRDSFNSIFPYLSESANTNHLEVTHADVLNNWDIISC
jgi:hypothetical protein